MRNVDFPQPPNRVIQNLAMAEIKLVRSCSTRVHMDRDSVLCKAGEPIESLYFPETAVVSVLGDTGDGRRVELWSVGNEGIAGITGLLSGVAQYGEVVQMAGDALAAPVSMVRSRLWRSGAFHDQILRYYEHLLVHIAQLGLCNSTHLIEQRLCRWLLMMQDRTGTRTLDFTHDFIAGVLGTRRATVSVAAGALQRAGWIRCTPGSIMIASRRGLQAAACGCYRKLRATL